ncbi:MULTISPECIES: PH domain-containing protein [unclassified Thioalkalivibrio]|uniref:PH domain-containing protein n=1 Tax=unclassified Thioalkalivibrio TaxID=2621013 RepID=UPI0003656C4A|nr:MULTISPECIES: PH domain-containing protein [unclassified Thioalkalivibrio]
MSSRAPAIDARPAMFRNHPFGFIFSVLLIAAFGLGLLILLWWYLQTRSVRLRIDADQVHLEEGLLSKSHVDLDIGQIRTVKVDQSFWNRIFRVGEIAVYTTGDNPEFRVSGIPDPHRVRDYVRDRREAAA